jgi:tetratricopeptide (TPR) repeat protein
MTLRTPFRGGRPLTPVRFWLVVLAITCGGGILASSAQAQLGERGIPSRLYHDAFLPFYEGEYTLALKRFEAEGRGCIKVGSTRWIDSICYETMVGECYYEMGMFNDALEHYSRALKLYLASPNWMVQVQFPATIRPSNKRVAIPWAARPPMGKFGHYPETLLIAQSYIGLAPKAIGGGFMPKGELYSIEVQEIVRCTALAIRRRAALLGPMGSQDPLNEELLKALVRRPGQPNHWSEAWIDLQLGLAYMAAGRDGQAIPLLQRATLAAGEYEHPLSSTAHVELGRLAMLRGDHAAASQHFEEATYTAAFYPDPGVLEEAFRYGLTAHFLANRKGMFPPLASTPAFPYGAATHFAKLNKLRQLQASLLLLAAENQAVLGQTAVAAKLVDEAQGTMLRRDMARRRMGARRNFVGALVLFQQGKMAEGEAALTAAMSYMRTGSFWLYHMTLVDGTFAGGGAALARKAMDLYQEVLRDPRPSDWIVDPMEAMAVLTTPHPLPFEHWFEGALARKDHEAALEISDRAKRHRFFLSQDMGGRIEALRWVLEGPMEMLDQQTQLQRQDLLTRYPGYDQLRRQALAVRQSLAALPLAPEDPEKLKQQAQGLQQLAAVAYRQEMILREMAVRREPATMAFPPARSGAEIQKALPGNHFLLVFFATSRGYYAIFLNNEKYGHWQVSATPATIARQTAALLRGIGNRAANIELPLKDLGDPTWKETANKVLEMLLANSRVELKKLDELVIVPDGALWYLPFEALQVEVQGKLSPLISRFRMRYAPTASLAFGPPGWSHRNVPNTLVVLGKTFPKQEDEVVQAAFKDLSKALPGCVALKPPAPTPSAVYAKLLTRAIVLDEMHLNTKAGPFGWTPLSSERNKPGGTLADWMALPFGGPDELILPGFHSPAEEALAAEKTGRAVTGNEMFLSMCGLMGSGARTVLVSRWRSGGQTSFDLVREFTQELPHTSPAEAWQRAVLLLVRSPLNLEAEPRIKRAPADEPMRANHPFFWAGYMLLDSACPPAKPDAPGPAPVIKVKPKAEAKPDVPLPPGPEKPEAKPKPEEAQPPAKPLPKPKAEEQPDALGPRIP